MRRGSVALQRNIYTAACDFAGATTEIDGKPDTENIQRENASAALNTMEESIDTHVLNKHHSRVLSTVEASCTASLEGQRHSGAPSATPVRSAGAHPDDGPDPAGMGARRDLRPSCPGAKKASNGTAFSALCPSASKDLDAPNEGKGEGTRPSRQLAGKRAGADGGDGGGTGKAVTGASCMTSAYRGVCWHKKGKKWQAAINSGRHVYLGSFDSQEEAARMFDRVAIRIRGVKAKLNFAHRDYLDERGRIVHDPKLEQLVVEARQAMKDVKKLRTLATHSYAVTGAADAPNPKPLPSETPTQSGAAATTTAGRGGSLGCGTATSAAGGALSTKAPGPTTRQQLGAAASRRASSTQHMAAAYGDGQVANRDELFDRPRRPSAPATSQKLQKIVDSGEPEGEMGTWNSNEEEDDDDKEEGQAKGWRETATGRSRRKRRRSKRADDYEPLTSDSKDSEARGGATADGRGREDLHNGNDNHTCKKDYDYDKGNKGSEPALPSPDRLKGTHSTGHSPGSGGKGRETQEPLALANGGGVRHLLTPGGLRLSHVQGGLYKGDAMQQLLRLQATIDSSEGAMLWNHSLGCLQQQQQQAARPMTSTSLWGAAANMAASGLHAAEQDNCFMQGPHAFPAFPASPSGVLGGSSNRQPVLPIGSVKPPHAALVSEPLSFLFHPPQRDTGAAPGKPGDGVRRHSSLAHIPEDRPGVASSSFSTVRFVASNSDAARAANAGVFHSVSGQNREAGGRLAPPTAGGTGTDFGDHVLSQNSVAIRNLMASDHVPLGNVNAISQLLANMGNNATLPPRGGGGGGAPRPLQNPSLFLGRYGGSALAGEGAGCITQNASAAAAQYASPRQNPPSALRTFPGQPFPATVSAMAPCLTRAELRLVAAGGGGLELDRRLAAVSATSRTGADAADEASPPIVLITSGKDLPKLYREPTLPFCTTTGALLMDEYDDEESGGLGTGIGATKEAYASRLRSNVTLRRLVRYVEMALPEGGVVDSVWATSANLHLHGLAEGLDCPDCGAAKRVGEGEGELERARDTCRASPRRAGKDKDKEEGLGSRALPLRRDARQISSSSRSGGPGSVDELAIHQDDEGGLASQRLLIGVLYASPAGSAGPPPPPRPDDPSPATEYSICVWHGFGFRDLGPFQNWCDALAACHGVLSVSQSLLLSCSSLALMSNRRPMTHPSTVGASASPRPRPVHLERRVPAPGSRELSQPRNQQLNVSEWRQHPRTSAASPHMATFDQNEEERRENEEVTVIATVASERAGTDTGPRPGQAPGGGDRKRPRNTSTAAGDGDGNGAGMRQKEREGAPSTREMSLPLETEGQGEDLCPAQDGPNALKMVPKEEARDEERGPGVSLSELSLSVESKAMLQRRQQQELEARLSGVKGLASLQQLRRGLMAFGSTAAAIAAATSGAEGMAPKATGKEATRPPALESCFENILDTLRALHSARTTTAATADSVPPPAAAKKSSSSTAPVECNGQATGGCKPSSGTFSVIEEGGDLLFSTQENRRFDEEEGRVPRGVGLSMVNAGGAGSPVYNGHTNNNIQGNKDGGVMQTGGGQKRSRESAEGETRERSKDRRKQELSSEAYGRGSLATRPARGDAGSATSGSVSSGEATGEGAEAKEIGGVETADVLDRRNDIGSATATATATATAAAAVLDRVATARPSSGGGGSPGDHGLRRASLDEQMDSEKIQQPQISNPLLGEAPSRHKQQPASCILALSASRSPAASETSSGAAAGSRHKRWRLGGSAGNVAAAPSLSWKTPSDNGGSVNAHTSSGSLAEVSAAATGSHGGRTAPALAEKGWKRTGNEGNSAASAQSPKKNRDSTPVRAGVCKRPAGLPIPEEGVPAGHRSSGESATLGSGGIKEGRHAREAAGDLRGWRVQDVAKAEAGAGLAGPLRAPEQKGGKDDVGPTEMPRRDTIYDGVVGTPFASRREQNLLLSRPRAAVPSTTPDVPFALSTLCGYTRSRASSSPNRLSPAEASSSPTRCRALPYTASSGRTSSQATLAAPATYRRVNVLDLVRVSVGGESNGHNNSQSSNNGSRVNNSDRDRDGNTDTDTDIDASGASHSRLALPKSGRSLHTLTSAAAAAAVGRLSASPEEVEGAQAAAALPIAEWVDPVVAEAIRLLVSHSQSRADTKTRSSTGTTAATPRPTGCGSMSPSNTASSRLHRSGSGGGGGTVLLALSSHEYQHVQRTGSGSGRKERATPTTSAASASNECAVDKEWLGGGRTGAASPPFSNKAVDERSTFSLSAAKEKEKEEEQSDAHREGPSFSDHPSSSASGLSLSCSNSGAANANAGTMGRGVSLRKDGMSSLSVGGGGSEGRCLNSVFRDRGLTAAATAAAVALTTFGNGDMGETGDVATRDDVDGMKDGRAGGDDDVATLATGRGGASLGLPLLQTALHRLDVRDALRLFHASR